MRRVLFDNTRGGFSIAEMLVTIGIIAILSGVMLGYNRSSEKQIALIVEREKVMNYVNRARSLALAHQGGEKICGFGTSFLASSVNIYKTVETGGVCAYSNAGGTVVETYALDPRITIKNNPPYVFFVSPYLQAKSSAAFPVTVSLTSGGTSVSFQVSGGGSSVPVINP